VACMVGRSVSKKRQVDKKQEEDSCDRHRVQTRGMMAGVDTSGVYRQQQKIRSVRKGSPEGNDQKRKAARSRCVVACVCGVSRTKRRWLGSAARTCVPHAAQPRNFSPSQGNDRIRQSSRAQVMRGDNESLAKAVSEGVGDVRPTPPRRDNGCYAVSVTGRLYPRLRASVNAVDGRKATE